MAFWPILVIAIFILIVFLKEEKAFKKENQNPDRQKGFYHPPKLQTPEEIAEEARQLEKEEDETSDRFEE